MDSLEFEAFSLFFSLHRPTFLPCPHLEHISGKHTCLFFIRVPCLIPLLGFYVTDCPFFLAVLYDHVYFEFLLPPLLLFLPTFVYQICVIM